MNAVQTCFIVVVLAGFGQTPPPATDPRAASGPTPAALPKVVLSSPTPGATLDGLGRLAIRGMVQESDAFIFWHNGALVELVGTDPSGGEVIFDTALAPLKKASAPGWYEFEAKLDNLPRRAGNYSVRTGVDVIRRDVPDQRRVKDRLIRISCDPVQVKLGRSRRLIPSHGGVTIGVAPRLS